MNEPVTLANCESRTPKCAPGRHSWRVDEIREDRRLTVTLTCRRCKHVTEASTPQGAAI